MTATRLPFRTTTLIVALAALCPVTAAGKATVLPVAATEGHPFTAVVAEFEDPNAQLLAPGAYTAGIDWGDSRASEGIVTTGPSGLRVWGSHTFIEEGVYTVRVHLLGFAGGFTAAPSYRESASGTATVEDAPLVVRGRRIVTAGRTFDGVVATFRDTDPSGNAGGDFGWVQQVHNDLFGRPVEPTALAAWLRGLGSGRSREELAREGVTSLEYRMLLVERLIVQLLRCAPDSARMNTGVSLLVAGQSVPELRAGLVAEPAYYSGRGGGSDAGFLAALFEDALGRPIDPAAEALYLGRLSGGEPRLTIARELLGTPESLAFQVQALYRRLLERPATDAEVAARVQALLGGQTEDDVVVALLASTEYFERVRNLSAAVAWGDGTTSVATVVRGAGDEFEVHASHTYGRRARPLVMDARTGRLRRLPGKRFLLTIAVLDGGGSEAGAASELRLGRRAESVPLD
jgi:hypothetical protein